MRWPSRSKSSAAPARRRRARRRPRSARAARARSGSRHLGEVAESAASRCGSAAPPRRRRGRRCSGSRPTWARRASRRRRAARAAALASIGATGGMTGRSTRASLPRPTRLEPVPGRPTPAGSRPRPPRPPRRAARASWARRTSSSTPTSPRPTSATGPAGSSAGRPRSCARASTDRGRRGPGRVHGGGRRGRAAGRQHGPRGRVGAAGRRGGAEHPPARRRRTRSTSSPRQVTVGAGATLARVRTRPRAAGLDVGVDLGGARLRHDRRHGGHERRRPAGVAPRADAPPGRGRRGRAGRRPRRVAPRRAAQGQHGLRPRRGCCAGARARSPWSPRCACASCPVLAHRATALARPWRAGPTPWRSSAGLRRRAARRSRWWRRSTASAVDLVADAFGVRSPFAPRARRAVLVECADVRDPLDELAAALADRAEVVDAALADRPARRAGLWAVRERCTDAVATLGVPTKLDVTLPAAELAGVRRRRARGRGGRRARRARVVVFGHVGDGNLHVNVVARPGAGGGGPPGADPGADVHERDHDGRVRRGGPPGRIDLGRARHRHGQAGPSPPRAQRRGARGVPRHPRPRSTPRARSTRTCSPRRA